MKTYILNSNKDAIKKCASPKTSVRARTLKINFLRNDRFEDLSLENGLSIFKNGSLRKNSANNSLAKSVAQKFTEKCFNVESLARNVSEKCFQIERFAKSSFYQIMVSLKSFESEYAHFFKKIFCVPCPVPVKVSRDDRAASIRYHARFISR